MGLAEPRRKTKMSFDPNNTTWGEDTSKFGYQLMNKMGWKEGDGLGRNRDGSKDHIKVRVKNNALGVGAKKGNDDNWLELQASFNNLLENLVQSHESGADNREVKVSKLEEKANASRRIFYSRFVKSKDVSKYSSTDMASIFGQRAASESPAPEPEGKESECTFTGVTTTTNTMSINDYFAQRLAEKKAAMAGGVGGDTARAADSAVPADSVVTPPSPPATDADSATASGEDDSEPAQAKKSKKSKKAGKKDKKAKKAEKKEKKEKKSEKSKGKKRKAEVEEGDVAEAKEEGSSKKKRKSDKASSKSKKDKKSKKEKKGK